MLGTQGNDMGFRFYQGDLLDGGRKLLADVWGFISPLPCGGYAGTLPLDDAAADATALRGRELKLHTHAGPSFRIDVEDACPAAPVGSTSSSGPIRPSSEPSTTWRGSPR